MEDGRSDPSSDDDFAIRIACNQGFHEIVKILKNHPNVRPSCFQNTPLLRSSQNGHLQVVEELLELPEVVNNIPECGAIQEATAGGYNEIVEKLLATKMCTSDQIMEAFTKGLTKGQISTVKLLLDKQEFANLISVDGVIDDTPKNLAETPLGIACSKDYVELAMFLLERGAKWLYSVDDIRKLEKSNDEETKQPMDIEQLCPFYFASKTVRGKLWYHVYWPHIRLVWIGMNEPTSPLSVFPIEIIKKITQLVCDH